MSYCQQSEESISDEKIKKKVDGRSKIARRKKIFRRKTRYDSLHGLTPIVKPERGLWVVREGILNRPSVSFRRKVLRTNKQSFSGG